MPLFLAVSATAAETVTLRLRNGDKVTGQIILENTNVVVVTTPYINALSIPADQIAGRDKVAPPPAPAPATNHAAIIVVNAPKKPATASPPAKPRYWHGEVQVGSDLRFAEKDRQLYYSRMKLTYARELQPKHLFKNVVDYNATYGETDGILSDNRMEGGIKTDYDLSRRIFGYNQMRAGYDEIQKIDYRHEFGPGVGYHVLSLTNFIANTEAGLNYQGRYFNDGRSDERFFYRLAQDSAWKINHKLSVDEKFEYFPRAEDLSEYRMRFETNLRYLLMENLFFNLTLLDLYDTDPARNVSRNDFQVRSSLGVKF